MAKVRSPNYPAIPLLDALEAVRPAYKAEHRNKMAKMTLAKHLGYNSLNGRSLAKIGAVRAYGLIEGSSDGLRVSDDAIQALMAPEGSPDRAAALARLALKPSLFKEIRGEYPGVHPSEDNLRYWLIKQNFTPDAAGKAAATYLETMRIVGGEPSDYNPPSTQEGEMQPEPSKADLAPEKPLRFYGGGSAEPAPGQRREVVTLDEGDVVITFPENLSVESFDDLKAYMDLFIKKMQRRAKSAATDVSES